MLRKVPWLKHSLTRQLSDSLSTLRKASRRALVLRLLPGLHLRLVIAVVHLARLAILRRFPLLLAVVIETQMLEELGVEGLQLVDARQTRLRGSGSSGRRVCELLRRGIVRRR